jgi:phosphatidate cytidylyltransferase
MFSDCFAMIFGRGFGKHKLFVPLSPRKTWEGLIGGIIMGSFILFYFIFYFLFRHNSIFFFTLLG